MNLSRDTLNQVTADVEDMAQYLCDSHQLSGELFWTVLSCLAEAKTAQLQGLIK
jgi:hypothetical protein